MNLKTTLSNIPGVGPTFAKRLAKLNLLTIEDLIYHYPFRYENYSEVKSIINAKVGEILTIKGDLWSIKNSYTRMHRVLTQAILNDGTGSINILWFNQPWLTQSLKAGDKLQISGKVGRSKSKLILIAPEWEKLTENDNLKYKTIHTGRLVPVYPETYGISSKWLRAKIAKYLTSCLDTLEDCLPEHIKDNMLPLSQALDQIHFPKDLGCVQLAKERLQFDELFFIHLTTLLRRRDWQNSKVIKPLEVSNEKITEFIKGLPFELTSAQKKVILEVTEDLKKDHPMNRLIQGDVGSGKTVVAAVIIYLIYLNSLKSVLMAPTEILAFQHYQTLTKLLSPFGITVGLYTGSKKYTISKKGEENIVKPDVVVGTHALLSDKLVLDGVGLVVIDEQQRFGVEQRSKLRAKAKIPHFLTMTATPIPRTVALTIYGDLDLSIINELPKGRKLIKTYFVPSKKRADSYKFIVQEVQKGRQIYIITPLIEESETMASAKAAKTEFERLKKDVFPDINLGLLHGKLKSKEKENVINEFKDGKIQILVSTSVVEVGVDVPNATIMLIEGAERFGLAQLHQLRGRVGRGSEQSYTFLFTEMEYPPIINRIKNLEKIYDGLTLSELDLQIRGSGQLYGTQQSGDWNLKIASFSDVKLIEKTKSKAKEILEESSSLDKYPQIKAKLSCLTEIVMPD